MKQYKEEDKKLFPRGKLLWAKELIKYMCQKEDRSTYGKEIWSKLTRRSSATPS